MDFYTQQLFHIYNQGNNRRQLFFTDEHYRFFLWKMRAYLPLFGDLVAWCLMPNHFHWLFYVKKVEVERATFRVFADKVELQRRVQKYGSQARPVDRRYSRKADEHKVINLNQAIGVLQNAFTLAINSEKGWTGSLFRQGCKAKDGWIDEFICVEKKSGKIDSRFMPGNSYAYQCLEYIHNNPVKGGLVKKSTDWAFSSAQDYAGIRKGTLCNLDFGTNLIRYL